VVEEIPAYAPAGEGDFDYLWIEKVDVSGPHLIREVARRLEVSPRDIGMAGIKDRRAITRQWISVPAGNPRLPDVDGPVGTHGHIRVLDTKRHGNKLRTGHLRGNRFSICVRGRDPQDDASLAHRLATMQSEGVPNTFGPQRFSRGTTLQLGRELLKGRRLRDRKLRSLAVSAVQSFLFNHWLSLRLDDGLLDTVLPGDILRKRETGGMFISDDAATDSDRLRASEIILTGPMPGHKYMHAQGASRDRDEALLAAAGLREVDFKAVARLGRGTRRNAIVFPDNTRTRRDEQGLWVEFDLPTGSYAMVLMALLCGMDLDTGNRGGHREVQPSAHRPPEGA